MKNRSGVYLPQPQGYKAFIPKPLPPDPPLKIGPEMQTLLSAADRAIGRLDAATELLPNPELFVSMYVRKEAVYSSQIEGTQASLTDILEFEAEEIRNGSTPDILETINHIQAMQYGLTRLETLPLSLRLIKEIHQQLLRGVRGGDREPGQFRKTQNWIGSPGGTINDAAFVPPPPGEVLRAMGDLETFIHDDIMMPPLVKCGLAHAQFETIHPFIDGNGRVGRLIITFLLCWKGVLKRPLLYISHYFKKHRDEYYTRLQAVRDEGDWEGWMMFFLEGVKGVSIEATETARRIQTLRDRHRELVGQRTHAAGYGLVLMDQLYMRPYITKKAVSQIINKTYPVASQLVDTFVSLDLLVEVTGRKRNRVYAYKPYLEIFEAAPRKG